MLRSPALTAAACPNSPLHKPLPERPRSYSAPPTPEIPELPGSILLENQGFPPKPPILELEQGDKMRRGYRNGSVVAPGTPRPLPIHWTAIPQHKKSLSENNAHKNVPQRLAVDPSPSSSDSKFTTCSRSTNPAASSMDSRRARAGSESGRSLQPSPMIVENAVRRPTKAPILAKERSEVSRVQFKAPDITVNYIHNLHVPL